MKIIITGATGMVGSEVLRQAILDNDIVEITVITRKPLDIVHPKVKTHIHQDFLNYSNLTDVFRKQDACVWCLGISQNAVSKEEYIAITYDYTLAAAKEMLQANPLINFLFLSGEGADSAEKSKFLFGRIKGKTENELLKLPFKKLYIARPGGIIPSHKRSNNSIYLKIQNQIIRTLGFFVPSMVITSTELAKVLLHVAKNSASTSILTHKEIKLLVGQSLRTDIPD
ncbi:MAG: NAD-dependent epimerase/dehydratase family protein [Candidatus Latescibacterota bacterium]